MEEYFKSKRHIENAKKASILGNKKLLELKEERVSEYNDNPNRCLYCNKPLLYEKKNNKYCNKSCSASYNNSKRKHSEETKEKIRKTHLERIYNNILIKNIQTKIEKNCIICNNIFIVKNNYKGRRRKTCCNKCRIESMKINVSKSQKERVDKGIHQGWKTRNIQSYPEKFFENVLKDNMILDKCKINYSVKKKDLGINCCMNYFLDFYFADKKLDLEIDGKQHEERKEHDNYRDEQLKRNGIIVYRIIWKAINNDIGKEYMKNEIEKFMNFYNNLPISHSG